jgi:phosphate uptake regulator
LREEGTDPREAVATALAVRYLKRTSSHLMNLASTVVTAFDEIGYHPGGAAAAPPGDEPSGP